MGYKGHTNYSEDLRKKVIEAHQKGQSTRKIAKELSVPKSSVHNIVTMFQKRGTVDDFTKFNGRPKKTEPKIDGHILKMAMQDPYLTVREVRSDLEAKGVKISDKTIRRRLKEGNFLSKRPKRPSNATTTDPKCVKAEIMDNLPNNPATREPSPAVVIEPTHQELKQEVLSLKQENVQLRKEMEMKDALIRSLNESRAHCYSCNQMLPYSA